ncbi:MAG: hypothetical protein JO179_07300 [Solirubrobacterales bacterium]|nr:hypothetical protein [Solirubrobacterales bacterium]
MSPGLDPFLPALTLPPWLCLNCGFWQRRSAPPPDCPLCLDARHVPPPTGFELIGAEQAEQRFPTRWAELEPGVWRFWNQPAPGIGPSGFVLQTTAGNVAFDGPAVWDAPALDQLRSLGGLAVISGSHPHAYGAIHALQDAFPSAELALHPADLRWSAAVRVTWPWDEELEVLPGITLWLTGGHFAGHTVLHDSERALLLCGDALKFELDSHDPRRALAVSAHKAFVRGIPLTRGELRRYRAVFAQLDFSRTWSPFEYPSNVGRDEALALIDRFLAGRPSADPVDLADLVPELQR